MGNPVAQFQILSKAPEETSRFYSALFGWSVDAGNPMGYRRVQTGSQEGIQGGIWPAPPQAANFVQLFMAVEDVGASVAKAEELGARTIIPPITLPEGDQMSVMLDPQGMSFAVWRRAGNSRIAQTTSYLESSLVIFRQYKTMAEGAIDQVTDEQLFAALDQDMNSIAIIVKHLAGNMRSRWTDFLTTDGEKPGRNRDGEFEEPPPTRAALMETWEQGWALVFQALEPLSDEDLGRTVTIRGEAHSVLQAINRQVAHYACHVGQIVLLAKHFRAGQWKSLSIPKAKPTEIHPDGGIR